MKYLGLVGLTVSALMAAPVMAQTYTQPVVERDTVPLQISQQQIKDLQRTLNRKGFSAGRVDGLWGPDTADALKRFQSKNSLNPTGELDRTTELKLGMIQPSNKLAIPASTPAPAPAQAATSSVTPVVPATPVMPVTPPTAIVLPPSTRTPVTPSSAANDKQPKPTSGANSFTEGQARDRIQAEGYQEVHNLALDSAGIWRGMATKNGQPVSVWLDYQGDVGK